MKNKNLKKENRIKLLSFDIDNTLIDFHTYKSNFTKTWVKYAKDLDIIITYNTNCPKIGK